MNGLNALRAVANRLTNSPVEELPNRVSYLTSSILNSRETISYQSTPKTDLLTILHKLKTRTSALLQDKTIEGRLAGIVVAKALIEAGGAIVISDSGNNWVRNLISCLGKPDPPESKRLAIVVITRIFTLTAENPPLTREITTPTLPAYISASLSALKSSSSFLDGQSNVVSSPLIEALLRSWYALIEHFGTTFRPNASTLKAVCLGAIGNQFASKTVIACASRLLASLHFCVPKNNASRDWSELCSQAIEASHDTADLIFRSVVEDWKGIQHRLAKMTNKQKTATEPAISADDALGLCPWKGVENGTNRLVSTLQILRYLLTTQHAQVMTIPLARLLDLTARLTSIAAPTETFSLRPNNEIPKAERDELWLLLPIIHSAVLDLLKAICRSYGQVLLPVHKTIATQLWDVYDANHSISSTRTATYHLLVVLFENQLIYPVKAHTRYLSMLVDDLIQDLHRRSNTAQRATVSSNGAKSGANTINLSLDNKDVSLSSWKSSEPCLYKAAYELLPILLTHCPWQIFPSTIRAKLDSTAILCQHHEAILASTLHPPQPRGAASKSNAPLQPSLIPFLARSTDTASEKAKSGIEALLRPRMPVITTVVISQLDEHDQEDDIEETENKEYHVDTIPHLPNSEVAPATNGKRDFTTILEESADAELAASHPGPDVQPSTKRARHEHEDAPATAVAAVKPSSGMSFMDAFRAGLNAPTTQAPAPKTTSQTVGDRDTASTGSFAQNPGMSFMDAYRAGLDTPATVTEQSPSSGLGGFSLVSDFDTTISTKGNAVQDADVGTNAVDVQGDAKDLGMAVDKGKQPAVRRDDDSDSNDSDISIPAIDTSGMFSDEDGDEDGDGDD